MFSFGVGFSPTREYTDKGNNEIILGVCSREGTQQVHIHGKKRKDTSFERESEGTCTLCPILVVLQVVHARI